VRGRLLALFLLSLVAAPAFAQSAVPAPPVRQQVDANGVDVIHGTFNVTTTDVAVGPAGPQGMAYVRSNAGGGWRDSLAATISSIGGKVVVSVGGSSDSFTPSGGGYTADQGNGATLVYSGGLYTYTSSNGTIAVFTPTNGQYDRFVANLGWAMHVIHPNGARTYYSYRGQNYCPHELDAEFPTCNQPLARSVRLQGVTNSYGNMMKVTYAGNTLTDITQLQNWNDLVQVTGINLADEYCSGSADTCTLTQTWPSASYSSQGAVVTDANGGVTTYSAGSNGITSIQPPGASSPTVTVTYDGNGRVSGVSNHGIFWNYAFVDSGSTRTLTVTDANSATRVYQSDNTTFTLTSFTDELGRVTTYQYDSNAAPLASRRKKAITSNIPMTAEATSPKPAMSPNPVRARQTSSLRPPMTAAAPTL